MSSKQPKERPMVKIVSDMLSGYEKIVVNNDQPKPLTYQDITDAVEDLRTQDKMRLTKDISKAVAQVLNDYTVEYRPRKTK